MFIPWYYVNIRIVFKGTSEKGATKCKKGQNATKRSLAYVLLFNPLFDINNLKLMYISY